MRLGVIADTRHHRDDAGRLCVAEPVGAQLEEWGALFDEVVLCVPLHPGPPPAGFRPYGAGRFSLVPMRPGGGASVAAKLGLATRVPGWMASIARVVRSVDALHIRCPCNIGLLGILACRATSKPRCAMYAGSWEAYAGEPWSYRLQRRLLSAPGFGGPVTIYCRKRPAAPHLVPFFSPTCSRARWEASGEAVAARLHRLAASERLPEPLRLVTVGELSTNKNHAVILEAVDHLRRRGVDVLLDVVGDGPRLDALRRHATALGCASVVRFSGRLPAASIGEAYRSADFNLLASGTEGYPKVVVEGMVEGAVPITSRFPMAATLLGGGARGATFASDDARELAGCIADLAVAPGRVADMVRAGRAYSATVTLEVFGERVRALLEDAWQTTLTPAGVTGPVEVDG